ncbi:hypothetical protein ISS03_04150 [Patescibacteria group bacterium]|nr:hypothetical protein [Patescibacteria group bacterium]
MKKYFQSIATLVGTIIGVGMFAVPYVVSKAGIVFFLIYLPVLAFVEYYLLKLYAEIVLSTKGYSRMPGYASKYIGRASKPFVLCISTISNFGSILAYIIIGGIFLHALLGPALGGSIFMYTTIFFAFESFVVLFGLNFISSVEVYMTSLLILIVGLIVYKTGAHIDLANYKALDWSLVALPYGPIFFAVGGLAAIPEICRLLENDQKKIKDAIGIGVLVSAIIIFIFVIAVVGVTGTLTTTDALVGLNTVFGSELVKIALVFGLLVVATSFLTIAQAQREVFWWDLKLNTIFAWVLACGIPYVLFICGIQNLAKVVSVSGAISGGLGGIVLILIGLSVKKKREKKSVIENKINIPIAIVLSILFILGLLYEVWAVFFNGF